MNKKAKAVRQLEPVKQVDEEVDEVTEHADIEADAKREYSHIQAGVSEADDVVDSPNPNQPPDFASEPTERVSWSQRIRDLHEEGKTTAEIAKILTGERGRTMRYQQVRNVLKRPLKRIAVQAFNGRKE